MQERFDLKDLSRNEIECLYQAINAWPGSFSWEGEPKDNPAVTVEQKVEALRKKAMSYGG